ncbi:MAG: 2Fe-2S ferredoxin [Balneola sp.]|nr:MAG: 2Fe-2S ferredoxin [Balneola sp.]
MAKITFITKSNERIILEDDSGSIMELATFNNVPGIEGNCGGVCSCANCHVHVRPEDFNKVGGSSMPESDMLEFEDNVTEYSRLSCQIEITEELNGITLYVANE